MGVIQIMSAITLAIVGFIGIVVAHDLWVVRDMLKRTKHRFMESEEESKNADAIIQMMGAGVVLIIVAVLSLSYFSVQIFINIQ